MAQPEPNGVCDVVLVPGGMVVLSGMEPEVAASGSQGERVRPDVPLVPLPDAATVGLMALEALRPVCRVCGSALERPVGAVVKQAFLWVRCPCQTLQMAQFYREQRRLTVTENDHGVSFRQALRGCE